MKIVPVYDNSSIDEERRRTTTRRAQDFRASETSAAKLVAKKSLDVVMQLGAAA
jgi:hypothetical protein